MTQESPTMDTVFVAFALSMVVGWIAGTQSNIDPWIGGFLILGVYLVGIYVIHRIREIIRIRARREAGDSTK